MGCAGVPEVGAVGVLVLQSKAFSYGFAHGLMASLVAQFQLPPTSHRRPGGRA